MELEVSSAMPNIWSSKSHEVSRIVGKKTFTSYLKLVGKKFVINSLLVVNFLTTLLVGALILRLKLVEDHKLFEVGLNLNEITEELVINGDVLADTLIPESDLIADRLSADNVEIVDPGGRSAIYLNSESVLLEAESYSIGESASPLVFKLNTRVESLQVPNGLSNVKYVRAPIVRPSSSSSNNDSLEDLMVESSVGGLELSGNLGIRGYSDQVLLDASKQIHLESRDESIHIRASKGIFLSEHLPHENSYNLSYLRGLRKDNKLISGTRQLLLIDPTDGHVYLE